MSTEPEPINVRVTLIKSKFLRRVAIIATYPLLVLLGVWLVILAATKKLVEVQVHLAKTAKTTWKCEDLANEPCKHNYVRNGTYTNAFYKMFWIYRCTRCGDVHYSRERFQ